MLRFIQILSGVLILALGSPGFSSAGDLVVWWRADGNTNNAVGPMHSAMLKNGATFGNGKFGQGFMLNGNGAFVKTPDHPNLTPPTNAITLAAWVFPNPANFNISRQNILSKYDSSQDDTSWGIQIREGGILTFSIHEKWGSRHLGLQSPPNVIKPGVWQHVAGTFSGGTAEIYVDGVKVQPVTPLNASTAASFIFDSKTSVRIGAIINRQGQKTNFFNGMIDEVMIFNRALTASEVNVLANVLK